MAMREFLNNCTACGGNWCSMLLTGIKRVFPDQYETVDNHCESIGYNDGGFKVFAYLMGFLERNGVICE